ncbi:unnamed protein product [Parnassius apollo]|uniref:(apollo) hypothetical protein n=1 Tax=Parnassius apollo TaxID=110799 RepID=A0A8S3W7Y8_PARAO|nr:unnamed protein product [Parnassius apollo]
MLDDEDVQHLWKSKMKFDVVVVEQFNSDCALGLAYKLGAPTVGTSIVPANIIDVGGYHVAKPKPLPNELQKFIEESQHGVIYISFGSMLRAASIPKDKLQTILDALAKLPQRVIWKWEAKSLPGKPKNIFLSKWLPQNDILGTTEAVYHGVPIIGMPMFGDQATNAGAIEESGFGVKINLEDLTKDNLLQKFKTVLDPNFRANVKLLSQAWHDRPISAMESAVYWTEFAARYHNFTFRTPAADVPFYQYMLLDIFFILFVMPLLTLFISMYYIYQVCLQRKSRPNGNSKKNH